MTPDAPPAIPPPVELTPIPPADLSGGNNLLQTGFWAAFKAEAGWRPLAFRWRAVGFCKVDRADEAAACREAGPRAAGEKGGLEGAEGCFLVLERRFPAGLAMAYVPYGPELPGGGELDTAETGALLTALAEQLRRRLSPGCFMVRFDLCAGTGGPVGAPVPAPAPLSPPLRRAPYRVQPSDTVILPLRDPDGAPRTEDSLFAGMHKKTRYNIRLAGKKGVEVRRFPGGKALEALPAWYEIYRETGRRNGIALHPESYYRRLLELAAATETPAAEDAPAEGVGSGVPDEGKAPEFSLYMAFHDGEALAGIIVSRSGRRSTYMYGASSSRKREFMPNYLLQWRAVSDSLAEGAVEYDFFGIPPADDPSHPMHGLWRMKTGFGGEIRHYLGAWDVPLKPTVYRAYAAAEKARGRLAALRKRGR